MADDELTALLGDKEEKPTPPEEETAKEPQEEKQDDEVEARRKELEQLDKAKAEALDELSKIRKEKRKAKQEVDDEEELPRINMEDPSSKAWDKHIKESVSPVAREVEQAKEERLKFALMQFLDEKPTIAKDPERMKRVMKTYEKIHENSGLTTEGILIDLNRAYNAEFYSESELLARNARINRARADEEFSSPGVSRGSTTYRSSNPKKIQYTEEQLAQIREWEKHGAPKID